MSIERRILWTAALISGALALASCGTTTVRYGGSTQPAMKKQGPPPHAPAHGYRHKHGDVNLVFKSDLGVYLVDGHSGYYFSKNSYYRSHEGSWQISAHFEGPWKNVSKSKLPKGLQKQNGKTEKKKKK
jgi:hypothetical protein